MTRVQLAQSTAEQLAQRFFQESEGKWRSQRRYYSLRADKAPEEVVSELTVRYFAAGSPELLRLASLHNLPAETPLVAGALTTWESSYVNKTGKPTTGQTLFGILGNTLYRDRGFMTSKPVTAQYAFNKERTMVLSTEYDGSSFEEELKLIGNLYRTRQTIISRAGEEVMIGQYLETRHD
ncbi:MAG: phycobiliprotein lyase [Cyanobacteria bacterium P01_H01_bin.15]